MTLIILPQIGRGLFPGRRLPPGEKIILLCASSEQRERVVYSFCHNGGTSSDKQQSIQAKVNKNGEALSGLPSVWGIIMFLPIKYLIQLLILYLERDVMRRQLLIQEKFRQPIMFRGKTGLCVEISFIAQDRFAKLCHVVSSQA